MTLSVLILSWSVRRIVFVLHSRKGPAVAKCGLRRVVAHEEQTALEIGFVGGSALVTMPGYRYGRYISRWIMWAEDEAFLLLVDGDKFGLCPAAERELGICFDA